MFLVVDCSFAYNAILRRPTLNSWNAVTSTYHLMIKFPTEYRVGEVRRDQVAARKCYIAMLEMDNHVQTITLKTSERWQSPLKDLKRFFLTTPGQMNNKDWHPHQPNGPPSTHDLSQRESGCICLEP